MRHPFGKRILAASSFFSGRAALRISMDIDREPFALAE
jgi:hypothetical protein